MWDTSCTDWEERVLSGRSLVPDLPLFEDEAARAVRVFNRLRIPDVPGMPTMEDAAGDWFRDIVRALFGAFDAASFERFIQEVFLLVPKKNAKTTGAAAVMMTAAIVNKRPAASASLIAPTKEIADLAFGQMSGMIKADPALADLFHIQRHIRQITHRLTDATTKVKAADTDTVTGSKDTFTLIDEVHQFAAKSRAREVFVELRGALSARPDGFLMQITTQSKKPPSGVFADELQQARDVRDGKVQAPLLPVLYELPKRLQKAKAWTDKKYFPAVNPNLGRSVRPDWLERELAKAKAAGDEQLTLFASQHLNVEIGVGLSTDGWPGAKVWQRGDTEGLTLEAILDRSEVVTVGIDGGGLDDLLGFAVIGRERETKNWLAYGHALIAPEGLEQRKENLPKYQDFEKDGDLTMVEALPDDLEWIKDSCELILDSGLLHKVGVDPAGIGGIVDVLAEIGITEEADLLIGVGQGIRLMNASKTVERKLADRSFKHGGSRLMAWCAGNARTRATSTARMIERAASGYGKIDPLMALFNAAHLMGMNPAAPTPRGTLDDFAARMGAR